MKMVMFDTHRVREQLLPISFTRPVADMRMGILTIREKWERLLGEKSYSLTESYLNGKFPAAPAGEPALYINGSVIPDKDLVAAVTRLGAMQSLHSQGVLLAFKTEKHHLNFENFEPIARGFTPVDYSGNIIAIHHLWDIFQKNSEAIKQDFTMLTEGRQSQPLSVTNRVVGDKKMIFLEEGAQVECAIINVESGPVYLGRDAEIMEGCIIRGPLALGEHAALKMGAKVYGATTVGPHCKAGGELNNSVLFGYSNKAHDGFLGNSVIGEWCNLGADTNNSNLKNNYGPVEIYDYRMGRQMDTGLTFCGLLMGDHSKSGINTMFNTGTVVGVSANIFGGDFPPKFIPSFSWGGAQWLRTFSFEKSLEVAQRMMERRSLKLEESDITILRTVYEREEKNRKNFK